MTDSPCTDSHQTKEKSYFAKPGDVQDGSLQLESACKVSHGLLGMGMDSLYKLIPKIPFSVGVGISIMCSVSGSVVKVVSLPTSVLWEATTTNTVS